MGLFVIPDVAELRLVQKLIDYWGSDCKIRLFENSVFPAADSVLADFTEVSSPGYTEKTLTGWTTPDIDGASRAFTQPADVTWLYNGTDAFSFYGYFVVDPAGELLWAERDPLAPLTVNSSLPTYTIKTTFRLSDAMTP